MDISIVVPNYNGQDLLKKNLPKVIGELEGYKGGKWEVIIVDDASTDSSESVITNYKLQITNLQFIKNENNLGFSSTVNKGVKAAKGEILILLNTDVYPEENFLEPLLKHFNNDPSASSEEPEVFAVGCLDKSIEGGKTILRGRGLGGWKRGFLIHKKGEVDKTNTLWVSGGSGAFRKSIWDKLGGLNELYNPFYWEDIDLSYRALKSGYKVLFEPKSVVVHEHEKGAIKSKYTPHEVKIIAYRNQFIFVWENATDLSLQFSHCLWLPYHFIKAITGRDSAFFAGFFRALILFPKIVQSSFKAQKLFVKKDKEVTAEFA